MAFYNKKKKIVSSKKFYPRKFSLNKRKRQPAKMSFLERQNWLKSILARAPIDYKNIFLLRKFITLQGKILPRKNTGITIKQQRYLTKAIKKARIGGLLPFIRKTKS